MAATKSKPFLDLILEAIDKSAGKRQGVSRQIITKVIIANHGKSISNHRAFYGRLRLALRRSVDKGVLVQTKQHFKRAKSLPQKSSSKRKKKSKSAEDDHKKVVREDRKGSKKKTAGANKSKNSRGKKKVELGNGVYEVDKILEEKIVGRNRLFFVKWKGFSKDRATWEPMRNILTPIVLKEWNEKKSKDRVTVAKHKVLKKKNVQKGGKPRIAVRPKKQSTHEESDAKMDAGDDAMDVEGENEEIDKVEDECPLKKQSKVYKDGSDIYTATLNAASRLENNSKFYIIQLLEADDKKFYIWTRWGRVGLSGVSKMLGPYDDAEAGKKEFHSKFKQKTGNNWKDKNNFEPKPGKYTLLGFNAADDHEESEGKFDKLMSRFRSHPNEGRELVEQPDEKDGEKVASLRTQIWQYYVDDGVDGKSTNWYDYDESASDVVDFAFKDWNRNSAVNVRAIKSGKYTYSVNFNTMEQTNIEHHNHKKRAIRRKAFKPLKRSSSFLGFE